MANISAIKLPNGTTYNITDKTSGYALLSGASFTGPVEFGDSVTADTISTGGITVTGDAVFSNNLAANTINGVTVGSSPKFTDSEVSTLTLASGSTAGTSLAYGNQYTLTAGSKTVSFTMPASDNTDTKVNMIARGTTKSYLLGTTTAPTSSTQAVTSVAETGVYFDTTAATLVATTFKGALTGTASGNLTSSSTLNAAKLSGAIPSTVTATTQTAGDSSTKIATTAFVSSAISGLPTPMQFIGTVGTNGTTTWANLPAASGHKGHTYKVITAHTAETGKPAADVGDALISNGTEWIVIPAGDETATQSATTGISIAAHGTSSVGSASGWSAGTASTWAFEEVSIPNVTAAGSASTWTFEEKTIPNVTSAGTASSWTFEEKSIPNVTAAGSGSASLTFAMDTTDTKKLKITFSHTHTAPTIGTAIKVQSKSGGSNGTAPTLGTAIKVQSKSGGANGTAPTLGTAIKVQSKKSGANSTVPSLTVTSTTVVTGTGHTITDNGHTHTI